MTTVEVTEEFRRELQTLINRYSLETESNTPDFVLAEYLVDCLHSFDAAVNQRAVWYGKNRKHPY
jgi:hypothetical protein